MLTHNSWLGRTALATCLGLFCSIVPSVAEVAVSGDVDPADPATWDAGTRAYIGKDGYGILDITNGRAVVSDYGYVGYASGATGMVSVDGAGSTWTNTRKIYVGYYGSGILNITDGGSVSNSGGVIGYLPGSTGSVTVDRSGSMWVHEMSLSIGDYGDGTLDITGGGSVSNFMGTIGDIFGSTGVVTVSGLGSTWINTGHLFVGNSGNGTLNITNGGRVDTQFATHVASNPGSEGEIHFEGGTLATGSLLVHPRQLTGTGTINTHGLVSDIDLVFDAIHGSAQALSFDSEPGQEINVNLSLTSDGYLGAGYAEQGSLAVRDGVTVSSGPGYLGYISDSTGVAIVDGAGSAWMNNGLYVGYFGSGTLNIVGGGKIDTGDKYGGYIGTSAGSEGVVTVNGAGSMWTNRGRLDVGHEGDGTLNISDGGLVSVAKLTIDCDRDGKDHINMALGGMLALYGQADASLADFLGLIDGTDSIRYWDRSIMDWADITGATYGEDYTLSYLTEGDLMGYTLLTVTAVPEPATLSLLVLGGLALTRRRRSA